MSADKKISEMTAMVEADVTSADDYLPIVDISQTTPSNRNRRITVDELAKAVVQKASAFTQSGTGAISQDLQARGRRIVFVTDFIPTSLHAGITAGTETTDVTTYIQAAIDAVNTAGGGVIYFPPGLYYCVGLVLKSGVVLYGMPVPRKTIADKKVVQIIASATGIVIDTPNGSACDSGQINGFYIRGLGSAVAGNGIRFRDANNSSVKNTMVTNFADEAILVDSTSISCTFEDLQVTNAVLNRTRVAKTGAVDLSGSDHFCNRCEVTASMSTEGAVSSANLYVCAWVVRGANSMFANCIGETSDVGWHLVGVGYSRFSNCRGDLNYGHGWEINCGFNMFATCFALNNSQDTTNTYDGFNLITSNAQGNVLSGCISTCDSVQSKKQRYGFNDASGYSAASARNYFVGCNGKNNATALYSMTGFTGSSPQLPHIVVAPADADATPTVDNSTFLRLTNYSTATTITDFDDAVGAQFLFVLGDADVTIQNNANIKTNRNADKVLRNNVVYIFQHYNGVWFEATADSELLGCTADQGDAGMTATWGSTKPTIIYNTEITADRAVALSTTNALDGAKFRVVRTANCTGAFNLNVGTGPLKALGSAGTWCDVEYNANTTAWRLTASGSL